MTGEKQFIPDPVSRRYSNNLLIDQFNNHSKRDIVLTCSDSNPVLQHFHKIEDFMDFLVCIYIKLVKIHNISN